MKDSSRPRRVDEPFHMQDNRSYLHCVFFNQNRTGERAAYSPLHVAKGRG